MFVTKQHTNIEFCILLQKSRSEYKVILKMCGEFAMNKTQARGVVSLKSMLVMSAHLNQITKLLNMF